MTEKIANSGDESPMSFQDRIKLIAQVSNAFSPSAPVNTSDLFAGRKPQIESVVNSVFQRGQHVIVFGERGVRKTSLASVLFDFLKNIGFQSLESGTINCDQTMDFSSLWHIQRPVYKLPLAPGVWQQLPVATH